MASTAGTGAGSTEADSTGAGSTEADSNGPDSNGVGSAPSDPSAGATSAGGSDRTGLFESRPRVVSIRQSPSTASPECVHHSSTKISGALSYAGPWFGGGPGRLRPGDAKAP